MRFTSRRTPRVTRGWVPAAAVAATLVALVAAGCGSSSNSSSSSKSTSSSSNTTAAASPGVAAAKAAVAPYLAAPTSNGITTPLTKKPPTGKTVVFVACNLPTCQLFFQSGKQAAAALGWNFKTIVTTGEPQNLITQFEAALALKPDAIMISGFPRSTYEPALKIAIAQHVPVVASSVGFDKVTPPYLAIDAQPPVFERNGSILGDWMVADSNGNAHVAIFTLPLYPVLNAASDSIKSSVLKDCSSCSVQIVDEAPTAVGTTLPSAVVSTIQSNPKINYVVFTDGNFAAGVPEALKAAGLSKVKVTGLNASTVNMADIVNGSESAYMAYSLAWVTWAGFDSLARHFVGDDPTHPILAMPTELVDKANTTSSALWEPANYQADFKKLWHVG